VYTTRGQYRDRDQLGDELRLKVLLAQSRAIESAANAGVVEARSAAGRQLIASIVAVSSKHGSVGDAASLDTVPRCGRRAPSGRTRAFAGTVAVTRAHPNSTSRPAPAGRKAVNDVRH
jgi:hypothetical protein